MVTNHASVVVVSLELAVQHTLFTFVKGISQGTSWHSPLSEAKSI